MKVHRQISKIYAIHVAHILLKPRVSDIRRSNEKKAI